jgi:amidase
VTIPTTVDVTSDDALGDDDVVGLLARLRRREVSAAEVRDAALDRARRADSVLNGVTTWVDGLAVGGGATDSEAPFAGIPTLLKDNEDLAGYPTSDGSWAVPDRPARVSTPWVSQLLGLGFVPIAKTTLPEFGLTATTESSRFGATRNPWDTGRSAGGSSGGSAALVAAGVVPLAHGNDGGGSIRIPASCCGLVGLKPSRGRLVDRAELEQLPVRITTQGVLTRTVRDTARYYHEAEIRYRNPALPPVGRVEGPGRARFRVGLVVTGLRGLPVAADVVAAARAAGRVLDGLGHHVEEVPVPVPDGFGPDFLRYWALLAFSVQRGGRRLYGPGFDSRRTEVLTQSLSRFAAAHAARLPGMMRRLRRMAREQEAWSRRFDVLVSPVLAHEPPPLGHLGPEVDAHTQLVRLLRWTSFTPLQNVTGAPGLALPLGRSASGLPVGVQLAAPVGHERRLLEVGYEVEAAVPWPTRPGRMPAGR